MSLIRIVRMEFEISYVQDFILFFESKKDKISNQPGCIHVELYRDAHFPNVFYTYSIWENEIQLEKYRMSIFFKETWAHTKKWFCAKANAYSLLPVS